MYQQSMNQAVLETTGSMWKALNILLRTLLVCIYFLETEQKRPNVPPTGPHRMPLSSEITLNPQPLPGQQIPPRATAGTFPFSSIKLFFLCLPWTSCRNASNSIDLRVQQDLNKQALLVFNWSVFIHTMIILSKCIFF